jgi:hypothetical protein
MTNSHVMYCHRFTPRHRRPITFRISIFSETSDLFKSKHDRKCSCDSPLQAWPALGDAGPNCSL